MINQDVVAQNPDEFAKFTIKQNEPGYIQVASYEGKDHYFIHARATLPLKDFHDGIGFALWVEVSKESFGGYLETENNDEKYLKFEADGTLANNWPGFENTFGLKVKLKTINASEKVYIWDVFVNNTTDPLFRIALQMQKHQEDLKNQVKHLVEAYMKDLKQNPGSSR